MNPSETAVATFKQGFSCSQAVLGALAPPFGLDRDLALRVAGGFGGGMGRTAGSCGAVTGAVMVLGLGLASLDPADAKAKEATYAAVREFLRRFGERHGSTVCQELLGCDISGPEGLASARARGLFAVQCPRYVADAVAITQAILAGPS
jgi:C_GCAxxG_C_C family probable redox protein